MKALAPALVASLLFASAAHAQEWRNQRERAQDRRELRQDKQELRDDRRDVAELEAVLDRFDRARSQRRELELVAVEKRLRELLREELAEGRVELARDKAEIRRDNREVRSEWGEGRRDLRDDRRDRRDDIRDARVEAATQAQRKQIAREMNSLMGSRRPKDLQRMRTLIVDLLQLARKEVHQTQQELREDRRELREDRRETREDRRR